MPTHNSIEYSSNYSETTGSVRFNSIDEATDFNVDIADDNNFQPFMYKAKLLEITKAQPALNEANGILNNVTTAVPWKYLSNFWRSLKMPLINWKVELKIKCTNYCVLSAAGADDVSNRDDNQRHNINCSFCNSISKRQSQTIKNS